jgi:hypothetical protein
MVTLLAGIFSCAEPLLVYVDCLAVEVCVAVARTEKPDGTLLNVPVLSADSIRAIKGALLAVCRAGVFRVVLEVESVKLDTVGTGFVLLMFATANDWYRVLLVAPYWNDRDVGSPACLILE